MMLQAEVIYKTSVASPVRTGSSGRALLYVKTILCKKWQMASSRIVELSNFKLIYVCHSNL